MSELKSNILAKTAYLFNHLNNSPIAKCSYNQQALAFSKLFKAHIVPQFSQYNYFAFDTSSYQPRLNEVLVKELNIRMVYPFGVLVGDTPTAINNFNELSPLSDEEFAQALADIDSQVSLEIKSKDQPRDDLKKGSGIIQCYVDLMTQHEDYIAEQFYEFVEDCLVRISKQSPDLNSLQNIIENITIKNIVNNDLLILKKPTEDVVVKQFTITDSISDSRFDFNCDFDKMKLHYVDSNSKSRTISIPKCLDEITGIIPESYIRTKSDRPFGEGFNLHNKGRYSELTYPIDTIYTHGYYLPIESANTHGIKIKAEMFEALIKCTNIKPAFDTLEEIINTQDVIKKFSLMSAFLNEFHRLDEEKILIFANEMIEKGIDIQREISTAEKPESQRDIELLDKYFDAIYESSIYVTTLSLTLMNALDEGAKAIEFKPETENFESNHYTLSL